VPLSTLPGETILSNQDRLVIGMCSKDSHAQIRCVTFSVSKHDHE